MAVINNIKGLVIKDGKVVYSEKLENGLYFCVILMYNLSDIRNNLVRSSELDCTCIISNGEKINYSNGVIGLNQALEIEHIVNGEFKDLGVIYTKDKYKVYQVDYDYRDKEHRQVLKNSNSVEYRSVGWIVEIPKKDLLNICINNM
jgi:hypothetical protein